MMRIHPGIMAMGFVFFFAGCTKSFDIETRGVGSVYVIEGRISNMRGPYLVRVTKTTTGLSADNGGTEDGSTPVPDARVIIADDGGDTDTLLPADPVTTTIYSYSYMNGVFDSVSYPLYARYGADRGYYKTTRITGVPGHRYQMTVRVGSETFRAVAEMPVAPVLDSVALAVVGPVSDVTADPERNAYVYFREPQGEANYYLLQAAEYLHYPYDIGSEDYQKYHAFSYVVFDDKTLPAYVHRMEVDYIIPGAGGRIQRAAYPVYFLPTLIKLGALTKEAYTYFSTLERQFLEDGNVYRPSPATAVGNISGGALGLFYGVSFSTLWAE